MEPLPGTLYVVGTPIGNLEDMTFRGVRILQSVDLIAAEDTRHTGKLLQRFQVKTPQVSYHEHNRSSRIPELVNLLQEGKTIALVSDAGMPGISDPGYELIAECVSVGIPVVPIPGATAAITALSASGLPTNTFVFEGFLPAKAKQRREQIEVLKTESRTIIFYESPYRLRDTLKDLLDILGNSRRIVIARELTKLYEEFWRGTLLEACQYYTEKEPQGEYTLLLAPSPLTKIEVSEEELKEELIKLISQGLSRSQASRQLAKATGANRRQLYQLALAIEGFEEKTLSETEEEE
jgi:16S rRNA (cytidine1402-2'-O)-methyltransferase